MKKGVVAGGAGEGTAGLVLGCGGCLVEVWRRFGACAACV